MKLHLCFAGIALLLVVASATAAETETEQLKQVQEVFQPLPRDMAMPGAPITPERVDLGRLLFFDPRLTVDADLGCSSCPIARAAHLRETDCVADDAVSCELVSAPNSLLTGKLTVNFANSGPQQRFPHLINELIQSLAAKFPTPRNREFSQS
jgi:cytochrome c peroxidase